jgi:type I restriction enzyme, S subunit
MRGKRNEATIELAQRITTSMRNTISESTTWTTYGFGSTEFHVIRCTQGSLDPKYLCYFLRQDRVRSAGERRMTGSAGQRRIPRAFLEELQIPLPTLDEQCRTAAILDQAVELRRKRRLSIETLEKLPQAIFAEMFDSSWHLWPELRLQDAVRSGTIITYGIVQAGEECPGGIPYIRTGDIVDGEISCSDLRHTDPLIAARFGRSRVSSGEIVMSIRATVGTTALVPEILDGANLTQGTARIAPGAKTNALYLLNFLRAPATQHWIQRQVKGATFREITLNRLRDLPVRLPPLHLQVAFANRVCQVQQVRAHASEHLGKLDTLFASLQHRAFHGELMSDSVSRELEMAV